MNDITFITLTDGQVFEFHPSTKFSDNVFRQMKIEDKQELRYARSAYRNSRTVNQMQLFYPNSSYTTIVPWRTQSTYTYKYPHDHASMMSQMTTNKSQLPPQPPMHEISPPPPRPPIGSVMGGHNNQTRSRHYQGGCPTWQLTSSHMVSTMTSTKSVASAKIHHSSQLTQPNNIEAVNESDSNTDTCWLGKSFIVYAYTSRDRRNRLYWLHWCNLYSLN